MKVISNLDESHVSGMVGMKAELEEVEKRMMERMSIHNSLKTVKGNKWGNSWRGMWGCLRLRAVLQPPSHQVNTKVIYHLRHSPM